jgi:release factor glutamine methyltransferase
VTYHLLRQRILRELRSVLDPLEAQREVRRWFEDGLGIDSVWLARQGTEQVPATTERKVDTWLRRRLQGEPWALILGWTPFFGRSFRVGRGALIPQTESETTVRVALEVGRALGVRRCVDVGAGVGNIGLTLALETDWELTLTELDPAALRLTRSNARALGLSVRCLEGDLLQPVPDPIELVVANMPFVDEAEAAALEADFNFEPAMAMLAPDRGMGLSHALLGEALARGARACVVEIGAGQGRELRPRALCQGWGQVSVVQDARGQDRVIVAQAAR